MSKTVSRNEIGWIKACSQFPEAVINAGFRIISNNKIYEYNFNTKKWEAIRIAERNDYKEIPQLLD